MNCIFRKQSLFGAGVLLFAIFLSSCNSIKDKKWSDEFIVDEKYSEEADQVNLYLNTNKFQGAVLVGIADKILFAKGYGPCDKNADQFSPITLNTTFEVGSITKQITAATIMQLVQKRKLKLNDKLSKFFPDYVYGDQITIEMLLNMRSGLGDHINAADDFFPTEVYRHIEKNQLACKPLVDNIVLDYFYQAPLIAEPDSTYFYSNTNYYLLAKILEKITGKSYYDYIKENIFKPCGMTFSNINFQDTQARGYDYRNRYYSIPSELSFGCGDINSSVVDLFKWNNQFFEGKVVSKKSLKKMLNTESYGFGIYRRDDSIFHAGTTNVFNSYDTYFLDDKLSVIVLTNCPVSQSNATFIAGKIVKIYKNSNK